MNASLWSGEACGMADAHAAHVAARQRPQFLINKHHELIERSHITIAPIEQ